MEKTVLPGLLHGNSHPNKKLIDHLKGVYEIARSIALWHGLEVDEHELEAITLTHDTGKEHPLFQKHLKGSSARYSHAAPSSFFTYLHTQKILDAEIVRNHHGQFVNIDETRNYWNSKDAEGFNEILKPILSGNKITEEEMLQLKDDLFIAEWDEEDWFQSRLKASLLITADRMDAMGLGNDGRGIGQLIDYETPKRKKTYQQAIAPLATVSAIQLPKTEIGQWRQQMAQDVFEQAKSIQKGGIYTLSLPTGAGKTLLGIEIASNMRPKTILYALPFISIVDQVAQIASSLFEQIQEDHHLVGEVENSFIQAFRYWRAPVVITTFAHFWDTLYSPRMNDTMNFHRFKDAFVILDETQSIPVDYWKGFGYTLKFLSEKMGTTFLLMTATQPKILNGKELSTPKDHIPISEATDLTLSSRYTVERLGRLPPFDLTTLVPEKGSGLVILNTRRSALKAYELIRRQENRDLYFLSRWVAPAYRIKRLQEVKSALSEGKECILIATQVVEAGIDLDFDWAIRDFAPLDNIIQACGRCNRNHRNIQGKVFIPEFITEKNRLLSTHVYDSTLLSATAAILPQTFTEDDSRSLVEKYYQHLERAVRQTGPWYDLKNGNWGNGYSLIRKYIPQALVFIDMDGNIKSLFEKVRELPKGLESRNEYKRIWKQLQQYAIEVPFKDIQEWVTQTNSFLIDETLSSVEELETGIYIIQGTGIGTVYLPECGFIPPPSMEEEYGIELEGE